MSKVKVPAAFDKWYKQVKHFSDIDNFKDRAMYLIASQGFGYCVADENNILGIDFDLTEKEVNAMRYYTDSHKEDAMRAILDGYEVEEQLYVVRLPDLDPENNYINYDLDEDCFDVGCKWESAWDNPKDDVYVDQFPMYVIEERLPKYVQYAEKVWQ